MNYPTDIHPFGCPCETCRPYVPSDKHEASYSRASWWEYAFVMAIVFVITAFLVSR